MYVFPGVSGLCWSELWQLDCGLVRVGIWCWSGPCAGRPAACGNRPAAAGLQGPAAVCVHCSKAAAVAACICVAEGARKATWRRTTGAALPSKKRPRRAGRLRPAGVWLAVFAGELRAAQYVVGRNSEECWISCCLVDCWLCLSLAARHGWTHGGSCLHEPNPAMSATSDWRRGVGSAHVSLARVNILACLLRFLPAAARMPLKPIYPHQSQSEPLSHFPHPGLIPAATPASAYARVKSSTLLPDQPCTSALPLQTVCCLLTGLGIGCTLRDLANLP